MNISGANYSSYVQNNGGRVLLLLLLFLLAIYELVSMGIGAFAVVCCIPILVLVVLAGFRYKMLSFWALIIVNFFIMWHGLPPMPIPMSIPSELLQIVLLALAAIDTKNTKYERCGNVMFLTLIVWCLFCTIEVLNDTCGIGIDVGAWYTTARSIAYQMMYIFLVFTIYISNPKVLTKYLYVWGALSLFAAFWVWKQKNIGFTELENRWLMSRGRETHVLQGGTLIRYFSFYNDAANFGIGIASTAVAFLVFGLTSKIRKHKIFFLITGFACVYAVFPSGTRTAIVCLMAGIMTYVFLSKSFKIAIPVTLIFGTFGFLLVFTTIGNGNQQIRRMRSAFDKNDASANVRSINQAAMKKYLAEAPWGIGMAVGYKNVPANNKYTFMATVAPDSEYVFIWIHTGVIGITTFLICTAIMILGACWIVLFRLRSPSLRGIGAGLVCAMVSQQLGGYGNQVLMQFPNCLIFYGGLTIVYVLPYLEEEWMAYEGKLLAEQEEKKRLKLEKKNAERV
jgi:hypothetical protein